MESKLRAHPLAASKTLQPRLEALLRKQALKEAARTARKEVKAAQVRARSVVWGDRPAAGAAVKQACSATACRNPPALLSPNVSLPLSSSTQSLILHEDLKARKAVLTRLGYLDAGGSVTLKVRCGWVVQGVGPLSRGGGCWPPSGPCHWLPPASHRSPSQPPLDDRRASLRAR